MRDRAMSLGLELMDRQLIDRDGRECGKVDDLLLVFPEDTDQYGPAPYVSAILTGPGAFAGRIRGTVGRWLGAMWLRLHDREKPSPSEISWKAIARLDYEVHLTVTAEQAGLTEIDDWLKEHIIERIPGA